MRYLHAIAAHERFVASGTYVYYEDNELTDVTEAWTIHEIADGAQFIRVDHDARRVTDESLLVEGLRHPNGNLERFNANYYNANSDAEIQFIRSNYTIFADYVQVGREVDKGKHEQFDIQISRDTVIFPPGYIFHGSAVRELTSYRKNEGSVLLPNIKDSQSAVIQKGDARFLHQEEITIGQNVMLAACYQLDASNSIFWINERDIPLKVEFSRDGHKTTAILTRYAHKL